MKLVKFTKDAPSHSAFCGEVMGFADDVADRLVRAGKAIYAEPVAVEPEAVTAEAAEELAADADDAGEDDDNDVADDGEKPAPRRRGRPRKVD